MDSRLRHLIIDEINRVADQHTENLVLTPKTWEEYLRVVGIVRGLRLAVELIEATYTEYMKT